MRILTEASGSLTSGYILRAIKEAGHSPIASDILGVHHGTFLADDSIVMPLCTDPQLWNKMEHLLHEHTIDIVIPSLDETLTAWAEHKDHFARQNIHVICSPADSIRTFQDKWATYCFFTKHGIPTPKTSLEQQYPVVKPRFGRGGQGVIINGSPCSMDNMISQEYIQGKEYTIDCLFSYDGKPIYIIPRLRGAVKEGKSLQGITVEHAAIHEWIEHISRNIPLCGPINFQCFETEEKNIYFIECNPRIAGGMALGFAASENWIPLIIKNILHHEDIIPKPVTYQLKMFRYYAECFIPAG